MQQEAFPTFLNSPSLCRSLILAVWNLWSPREPSHRTCTRPSLHVPPSSAAGQRRLRLSAAAIVVDGTRNCFIKSQTGSGKTLAYLLPVVQGQQRIPLVPESSGTEFVFFKKQSQTKEQIVFQKQSHEDIMITRSSYFCSETKHMEDSSFIFHVQHERVSNLTQNKAGVQ